MTAGSGKSVRAERGERPAIECAYHGQAMTLDRTVVTWGLGRCCLGCGLPVSVRIEHPGPTKAVTG